MNWLDGYGWAGCIEWRGDLGISVCEREERGGVVGPSFVVVGKFLNGWVGAEDGQDSGREGEFHSLGFDAVCC